MLTDRNEISNLYRFLEIDQSETKLPVAAKFVNKAGRNEQSL